jgi:hypothetical protein
VSHDYIDMDDLDDIDWVIANCPGAEFCYADAFGGALRKLKAIPRNRMKALERDEAVSVPVDEAVARRFETAKANRKALAKKAATLGDDITQMHVFNASRHKGAIAWLVEYGIAYTWLSVPTSSPPPRRLLWIFDDKDAIAFKLRWMGGEG